MLVGLAVAAFLLRKRKGGLLGAVQALFSGGFVHATLRVLLEVGDLATDLVATANVVHNDALRSFHSAYSIAFGCGACVSLFALALRASQLRRRWRRATGAVAADTNGDSSQQSGTLGVLKEGMAEAFSFASGLDVSTALDAIKGELENAVAIKVAILNEDGLETKTEELREAVRETRLTVLVLGGEALPMTSMNLWLQVCVRLLSRAIHIMTRDYVAPAL